MFIDYMYVDNLFSPTKPMKVTFEDLTTHYQTLLTWICHNATRYHTFSFSLAWFGAI